MTVALHHGDCLDVIPRLVTEGVVVDSVVCDPPYHLTSTVARFGKINISDDTKTSQRLRQKLDGAARLAHGFMNQQWDGGDIAFRPETWATVATIMRPGAFLVAFGGTRTHHRLACAIEDAGFVIQDCLMWLFATGFPKRRDALKPAYEPIILAYKPGGKRTMQVKECLIGGADTCNARANKQGVESPGYRRGFTCEDREWTGTTGRWPANLCHDGSDEVVGMFPQSAGKAVASDKRNGRDEGDVFSLSRKENRVRGHNDEGGSAARFFFSAKAGAEDRWGSRHPTVKPVELISWLVKLVCPPGGTFLDTFAGSGTAGVAALATGRNAILIEREDNWFADIKERMAFYEGGGMHSVQAKHRGRKIDYGPLFAEAEGKE